MPRISGASSVKNRLARMSEKQKVALVGQALYAGGEDIRAYAARSITENSISGAGHIPSKPGEPPSNDTGHLRSNLRVEQPAPLRVLVSSNAQYSAALEHGTSQMAARPFMGPAARAKRKQVVARVAKVINLVTAKKG